MSDAVAIFGLWDQNTEAIHELPSAFLVNLEAVGPQQGRLQAPE